MKRSSFKRRTGAKTLKPQSPAEKRARTLRKRRLGKEAVARSAVKAQRVWKSTEHIKRVRAQRCLLNRIWHPCDGRMDPHHCRKLLPGGLLPRHDSLAVPLCRRHHKMMDGDERKTWKLFGVDPRDFIRSFSPEGAAALAELERAASGKG